MVKGVIGSSLWRSIQLCLLSLLKSFGNRGKEMKGKKGVAFAKKMSKEALGCEALIGSLVPSKKRQFKMTNKLQEGRRQRPVYAIVFNFLDDRYFNHFATVSGNQVSVYQCLDKDGHISLLQTYADDDKDESFYTVTWACNLDGEPLLVAGGTNRVIRIIDVNNEKIQKSLVGHGDSINEIRTQMLKPSLILSASKDESVRLWNVHTGICILIFAGTKGHRNQVLSVDFHMSDIYCFASCGMDNIVRVWSMSEFWTYVEKSYTWNDHPSKFPTKCVQFPKFSALVHTNYVDCNRWFGDSIMSKSVENEIVLWVPQIKDHSPVEGTADILHRYPVPNCDIWFIKFSYDFHYKAMAIGNKEGKIFVWDMQSSPPVLLARLCHPQSKVAIRQTAMSADGKVILACCEDGAIWRWDEIITS